MEFTLISDEKGQDWIAKALENDKPQAEVDLKSILSLASKDWKPEKVQPQALAQVETLTHLSGKPETAGTIILPMV